MNFTKHKFSLIGLTLVALLVFGGIAVGLRRAGFNAAINNPPSNGGAGTIGNSVNGQSGSIIRVKTNGNDALDGSTWALAKQHITNAISSANAGDQIWAGDGTYPENLTITKPLSFYGGFAGTENGLTDRVFTDSNPEANPNPTTIDGNGQVTFQRTVKIQNATGNLIFDNLNIINGQVSGFGGGINVIGGGSSISLNRVVIANNKAAVGTGMSGAGMYMGSGTLAITGSVFHDNDGGIGVGGGLRTIGTNLNVNNTIFRSNKNTSKGGGIELEGGIIALRNSTFYQNQSANGGAIYFNSESTLTNADNYFYGNISTASTGASAIAFESSSGPLIGSQLFVANTGGPVITADAASATNMTITGSAFIKNQNSAGPAVMALGGSSNTRFMVNAVANNVAASGRGMISATGINQTNFSTYANNGWQNSGPVYENYTPPSDNSYDPKYNNQLAALADNMYSYLPSASSQAIDSDFYAGSFYVGTSDINACDRQVGAHRDLGPFEKQGPYANITLDGWKGPNSDGDEQSVPLNIAALQNGATTLYLTKVAMGKNGEYVIPKRDTAIPANTAVTLHIAADKFLHKTLTSTTNQCNGVPDQNTFLVAGDQNNDGHVDLNHTLTHFGTNDPASDLNGDGVIDLFDLNINLRNFFMNGDW